MSIDPVSLAITVALNAAVMGMTMMQKIEGPRLQDLSVSTADYGTPLVNVHGAIRVECPCFYAEPIREEKHQTKTKGGKYTQYTYFGTWASFLTDHQIDALLKVWLDRRMVLNRTTEGPMGVTNPLFIDDSGKGIFKGDPQGFWRVYYGTEEQLPDPRMLATVEDEEGVGTCPAYRGVSYMFFEEVPLEKFGNRMPQVSGEPLRGNGNNPYPFTQHTPYNGLLNSGITPSARYLITTDSFGTGDHIKVLDLATQTVIVDSNTTAPIAGHDIGIADDTTFYALSGGVFASLWQFNVYGGGAEIVPFADMELTPAGVAYVAGTILMYAAAGAHSIITAGGAAVGVGFKPTDYFSDIDGNAMAVGPTGTGDVGFCDAPSGTNPFTVTTGLNGDAAAMDNGLGQYFLYQSGFTYLVDKDTHAIVAGPFASELTSGSDMRRYFETQAPGAPSVWIGFTEHNASTGEAIRTVNHALWMPDVSTRTIYDRLNHAIISEFSTDLNVLYLDRVDPNGVTLGSICTIVAQTAGMQPGDFTFAELDQIVPGYAWTQGAGKDIVGALLEIYDSDIRPHGFMLEGKKRGQSLSGPPISEEWMVPSGDQPLYRVPVAAETDLPRRVFCTFADSGADDQPNTAIAQRNSNSTESDREQTFDLSTMRSSADYLQPMVERALRRIWVAATKPHFTITPLEILLEPADVRVLSFDGERFRCKNNRMIIRADRSIETEWEVDGETSVDVLDWTEDVFSPLDQVFNSPGGVTNGRPPDVILIPTTTAGFVLDTPLLSDVDDSATPFTYVAAAPNAPGFWPGTGVWNSDFGGDIDSYQAGWETFGSTQSATYGYATTVLPSAATDVFDNESTLRVALPTGGSLSSATEDQLLADPTLNLAVLGSEVIQFKTATLVSSTPKTYDLTGFVRGARGTEYAVGTHTAAERFLLVNSNVRRHLMGASEIGDTDYYKFSVLGDDLATVPEQPLLFAANANRPLSPSYVTPVRAGSGDWGITWQRRTRVGGSTINGQDVPLGETSELYRVRIMNGSTVVRSLETTTESATYTLAQQVADWGSGQSALTVEVVQVSPSLSLEGFATTASA